MVALSDSKDSRVAETRDFRPAGRQRTPTEFGSKYGPWALVTGASAGIGREFARQLAAEGLNLVLASRSQSRLEQLADDLVAAHRTSVRTVPVNLGRIGSTEDLEELDQGAVGDLDQQLVVGGPDRVRPEPQRDRPSAQGHGDLEDLTRRRVRPEREDLTVGDTDRGGV